MPSRGQLEQLEQRIRALSDEAAVRALTALVEERGLLPEARQHAWSDGGLKEALAAGDLDSGDLAAYADPDQPEATEGELARAVLEYAAAQHDDLARTVGEAVEYASSPMHRVEPLALSVTVLVVVLLQTEVVVKRDTRGRWSFTVHKRAMRDAALGRVFTALLSRISSGK
ncbi:MULTISPECIES: hypothetical protein [Streptomyces]|uniref:hypothetical protein n=1 Tax=Streptomyces TaxID=1883 RepID=UPI0013DA2C18|nr:hypothetical protein [Streptomyces aureoverticillatus]QIB41960.1 hypothetical protein G3H79_01580 [Streptomyces aureoverticillatus]